jgi:hypothetical protein
MVAAAEVAARARLARGTAASSAGASALPKAASSDNMWDMVDDEPLEVRAS